MPQTLFDAAGLAVVAYAEINGADGTSTYLNSGVSTTRTATGLYTLTLPGSNVPSSSSGIPSNQLGETNDLVFVTPKTTTLIPLAAPPVPVVDDDDDPYVKNIKMINSLVGTSSFVDATFSILILRCINPPLPPSS